jgi:hypothetical protein
VKSGFETILIIAGGSVIGLWALEKYFGSQSFAAKNQNKMMMMKKMDMMMAADEVVDIPKCMCSDGMEIMAMKVKGQKNMFTCDECAQHEITGAASGVRILPQSTGVRGNQLQTVPNLAGRMMMPMLPPGATLGLLPGGTSTSGSFAAEDATMGDTDIMKALMDAGVGKAEQMKVKMAVDKQKMVMKNVNATCTCPDKTKVKVTNGMCDCGAVNVAGAIGLNRNIQQIPAMQQRMRGQRMMMQQEPRMRAMGGVSPTNTGQVCVLDTVANKFVLSGTNPPVQCDPGTGLTVAKTPMQTRMGETARNPLDMFTMTLPATNFAKAFLAPSSEYGSDFALPLIEQDDEDLYEDYGNLRNAYPNSSIQDLVSPYDEDSHTLPFFITEPESYRQVTAPISNIPRR